MPHMLSAGKEAVPERTMIFELWGNIGLRKGELQTMERCWEGTLPGLGRPYRRIGSTPISSLFDLSNDVAEENDLRDAAP